MQELDLLIYKLNLPTCDKSFARYWSEPNASQHELTTAMQYLYTPVIWTSSSFNFQTPSYLLIEHIQGLVRFRVYYRIKPHDPLLVLIPANSFEFHSCEHTLQVERLTLSLYLEISPKISTHLWQRGLLRYLILFDPHAFVPQRQSYPSKPPSPTTFLQSLRFHSVLPLEFRLPLIYSSKM